MSEQTNPEHGVPQQGSPAEPTADSQLGFGVDEHDHGWASDVESSGEVQGAGHKAYKNRFSNTRIVRIRRTRIELRSLRLRAQNAGRRLHELVLGD